MDWTLLLTVVTGVLLAQIIIELSGTFVGLALRKLDARNKRRALAAVPERDEVDEHARKARHLFEPERDDTSAGERTAAIEVVRGEMARSERAKHLVATPPTVNGLTLFHYLRDAAPRQVAPGWASGSESLGAWANVVEDFYGLAGADPAIAAYFTGTNMIDLKRHFLRALVTLFSTGLTVEAADALGEAHAHLGITATHFDQVTGYLVQALKRQVSAQVIDHVLPQLSPAVQALRTRIVQVHAA